MNHKQRVIKVVAWSLSSISVLLAILAWGNSLDWHIFGASTYLLFPIFGLVAFSLLWSQYITLALRYYYKLEPNSLSKYFVVTGYFILLAILLHPGLLIWQLWRDGQGLPPGGELHYVMPSLKFAIILGEINLLILILFELRRFFANKPWWRYATYLVDLVMLSIFYHGLRLGNQLHSGWYRIVWYLYGATLLFALGYIYKQRFTQQIDSKR